MTKNAMPYLDIDFAMTECESELVVSVRTNDGTKLTQQDVLDGMMAILEEAFTTAPPKPLTKKERETDPDLH